MLIDSDFIKTTKKHIEVMQAFIDGKEIEYRPKFSKKWWEVITPTWNFLEYEYRIKQSDKKNVKHFTSPLHSHSDSLWEHSKPIEKTHNVPFFHSIMADQFVELGIELPDYMVKQLSPAKLDYLAKKADRLRKETGYPKFEESIMEDTEIKPSEPEYVYPIYKRLKTIPETVVKFMSLDAGIYVSTHDKSIYKPGDAALNMAQHTDSSWEDAPRKIIDRVRDSNGKIVDLVDRPSKPENANTEELFEVFYYCEIMKEFEFVKQLYKNEDLENKKHLQKTGRSFIFDKDTKKIIKVINA